MRIVLWGFMGSGKSKVGQLLSKKIGVRFIETDALVEAEEKSKVAKIIKEKGEPYFRSLEKKAVQLAVKERDAVISTGGGAVEDPENFENLQNNSVTIWLKVSPEVVLKRVGKAKSRPLINPLDPLASIKARLSARQAIYAKADHAIGTDLLSAKEVVEKILEIVN